MALNFENALSNNARPAAQERAKTQIWLNVGFETQVPVMRDGEQVMETRFINLPVGIPIDTTEKLEIRGQNEEWNKLQGARNWLLEQLQKHGAGMGAGAEEVVQGLVVKIKRVAAPAEVSNSDNDFIPGKNALKFG
ncbi:RNA polymerase RNAP1 subunit A protein [Rhizobium phage RHph_X2_28B]|uniref:RNA polymerase RNAP1 subunit A protein n=1 Tax=Rhizobium phage RHph_X2_28B TaxID=2836086 RepID=UPI0023295038|nr:RNA polymerase RNAP1 subunit A protein [Rhizobium phage RHph_X2_28B]QWY83464.1 RNA polymerase RNAP1 subunit A protein [Rhizobium phage RHph_X2_28B]QWY83700.1 RNA polymerase RNAP1 subunit A protein [Rhizobium phage RHph_X3_15]